MDYLIVILLGHYVLTLFTMSIFVGKFESKEFGRKELLMLLFPVTYWLLFAIEIKVVFYDDFYKKLK